MKKFKSTFDTLLRVSSLRLEALKRQLTEIEESKVQVEREERRLKEQMVLSKREAALSDFKAKNAYHLYAQVLTLSLESLRVQKTSLEDKIRLQREKMASVFREKQVVEKLRERKFEEWQAECERKGE